MKSLTLYYTALLVSVAYGGLLRSAQELIVYDDDYKIPGDNPLYHCDDPKDDILTLKSVGIDPNPPLPGKNVTIVANGTLNKPVEEGATIHLQVKVGMFSIINQHSDLCEVAELEDLECPVSKGDLSLTDGFTMPDEIPPAKYTVIGNVLTKDGDTITCITGEVEFKSSQFKLGL